MSNILIAVSGGIAAYKVCDLISMLRKDGNEVRVVMTEHAKEFITPMTLATLSRHPVMDNMWTERNGNVDHIDIGKWTNKFVVYPATANIIAKFANGIADDLLSTIYLALPSKTVKYVFPAANTNMINHPAIKRNIIMLRHDNVTVADTRSTELACGDVGNGAVLSPKDAFKLICGGEAD